MSLFIVDILEDVFGDIKKHNHNSGQVSVNCPLCDDGKNKANLEINYSKNLYNCWSCGAINNMHGSIESLLKKYGTKKQLKQYLLLKPETEYDKDKKEENKKRLKNSSGLKLPEGFKLLKNCTNKDFKYEVVIKYLKERGITDEMIEYNDIGYTTTDKLYYNRIIIPSYNENNELNYFVTRAWDKRIKPKYLNPPEDEVPKLEIIFNENKINWDSTIYIVEGITDHIVIPNSLVLLGKVIGDKLKETLFKKAKGLIVILLDGDAFNDIIRLYKELNTLELYGRVRICVPPLEYDPSKINEIGGRKAIIKLLKNSRKPTNVELY